jgi:hypothetical protein
MAASTARLSCERGRELPEEFSQGIRHSQFGTKGAPMRITVANALSLAASLTHAAANAQQSGATDFDLLDALAALDDDARAQLAAAIAQADGTPSS